MGQITTGVGLVSGLDIASIVEQLVAIDARPRTLLQNRNEVLRSQQVAFQEINARLLALKTSAGDFAGTSLFTGTTASTSNENVLTASSGIGAVPGTYSFIVNRLVSAQQSITRGFQDASTTPVAANGTVLSFDRGEARLDSQTRLSRLNGGDGINRGQIRITDRSGATSLVDLTSVVTVDDVIDKINNATGINVIAEIDGDRLSLTDASGSTLGELKVTNVGTSGTATSLGIATDSALDGDGDDNVLTGANINTVGRNTLLASLNDGKGVRASAGNAFTITASDATSVTVDLSGVLTLGDLFDQIEEESGGVLTAQANDDGTGIKIIDNSGGGAGFTISAGANANSLADLGLVAGNDGDGDGEIAGGRTIAAINSKLLSGINGGGGAGVVLTRELTTATNLSALLDGTGLSTNGDATEDISIEARDGSKVLLDLDSVSTVQELIDLVNTESAGALTLSVEDNALRLTDNTGSTAQNLIVSNGAGSSAAAQLGLVADVAGTTVLGSDTNPAGTYQPGTGLGTIRITNSLGAATDIDLAGAESVSEVLDRINSSGAGVTASLNNAGTGLKLADDTTGTGDLTVADQSGEAAAAFGLAGTFANGIADSGDLEYAYINGGTRLDDLGIARGQFTIRDSDGDTATVDLTQGNELTINDLLSEINSRGLDILARVNDTGDGIVIEDLGSGAVAIQVEDSGSTTARDLGLLGTAANAGEDYVSSFEKNITVTSTDSLQDVANKINDANVGVAASVINDGSPGAPFRLSLSSESAGTAGAFTFDDGGAGFAASTLSRAQDAVVFYGGNDPATSILIESRSNTLSSVIPGADITLLTTSDQATQVTIGRDEEAIISNVDSFVTSFNSMIDTLNRYDSYDAENEVRGLLLGDSTVSRIRSGVYNAVINPNNALTGQYKSLAQVGIRVGAGAKLEFDQNKFREAMTNDREAVEALFNFEQFEIDPDTGEETETLVAQGIGVEINNLLERLTDSIDGTVQQQLDVLDQQVQLNENRIESLTERLDAKRDRLNAQFIAMESALAQLQDQSSALAQIQQIQAPSNN